MGRKEFAIRRLNSLVLELPDDMPTFRGVPVNEFEYDDLLKLCRLFANEWKKTQQDYFDMLKHKF